MTQHRLLLLDDILAIYSSPPNMNLEHTVDVLSAFVDPELVHFTSTNRNLTSRLLLVLLHDWSHISKAFEGLNFEFLH
jgi:hypothetical protein